MARIPDFPRGVQTDLLQTSPRVRAGNSEGGVLSWSAACVVLLVAGKVGLTRCFVE